jgi:hypothetical protein
VQNTSVDHAGRANGVAPDIHKRSFRRWLKHWIGLDRAILYTVMARFWSSMAGVVTLLLIVRYLTSSEQGFYYTFSSLVALQIVFELGFSFVILQLAAHERAHLSFLPDGHIEGDAVAHSRLASILQKAVRWYSVAGILMTAAVLPAGFYFFRAQHGTHIVEGWKAPWCLLVLVSMLAFQIDPVFSFLEGCGFITDVAQRRFAQAVVGSALAWLVLALHHGLYAPAMVILGQVAVGLSFLLLSKFRPLLSSLLFYSTKQHYVGWREEILPFQWRIAVSWICGYFIYGIINPILFKCRGPVAAGRMGMSLSIVGSIGAVATAWMGTKQSPFGAMIARGEIVELDRLFFRTVWQSTALFFTGAVFFLLVIVYCEHNLPKLAMRVLPPGMFILLLLTMSTTHILSCEALYLRAHKQEPFLWITIIGAVLVASTTFLLAKFSGINGVVIGNFLVAALYTLPAGTYVFIRKRKEWHGVSPTCVPRHD